MGLHFMAVLGTSLYEPIKYSKGVDWETKEEEEFIQLAYVEKWKEELKKDGKVTIFVTDFSEKRNWKDREYDLNDQNFAAKWNSDKKKNVIVGGKKKGMETQITERFPELKDKIECIKIPDGKNEEEIDQQFQIMFGALEQGDEVVFDITHSFRSIPMLAMTVVNYARILLNCTLREIIYGAFEARNRDTNIAPIFDLTMYNEILEWTGAAEMFIQYGNARPMNELVKKKKAMLADNEKSTLCWLENRTRDMALLTDNIATCRGQRADCVTGKSAAGSSIQKAYLNMQGNKECTPQNRENREIKPLLPLIEKAEKSLEAFHCEENYKVGMQVVKWSIKNNMIQQGYTALEESVKTYLCSYCDVDDALKEERENFIGNILGVFNKALQNCGQDTIENRNKVYERWLADDRAQTSLKDFFEDQVEKRKELAKKVIFEVDWELVKKSIVLKERRNDINHFGMRKDPFSSEKLKKDLNQMYLEIKDAVERMEKRKIK